MIETENMTKQILDMQKGAFASWYGVISAMQEQTVTSVSMVLDRADWMPDEGRRLLLGWMDACKDSSDRYKAYMDDSLGGLEKYLAPGSKQVPVKSKKPVAKPKVSVVKSKKPAVSATPAGGNKIKPVVIEEKTVPTVKTTKTTKTSVK